MSTSGPEPGESRVGLLEGRSPVLSASSCGGHHYQTGMCPGERGWGGMEGLERELVRAKGMNRHYSP